MSYVPHLCNCWFQLNTTDKDYLFCFRLKLYPKSQLNSFMKALSFSLHFLVCMEVYALRYFIFMGFILWFLFSKITCVIFQLQKYSPNKTCKWVAMKFKPISMHTKYRLNTMVEAGRIQIPTQFFSSCLGIYQYNSQQS